jgi:hypothetical protein
MSSERVTAGLEDSLLLCRVWNDSCYLWRAVSGPLILPRRRALLGIGAAVACSIACSRGGPAATAPASERVVFVFESEGNVRAFESHDFSREQEEGLVKATLAELGARELACPAAQVTLHKSSGVAATQVMLAVGCGKQSAYLVVDDEALANRVPGFVGHYVIADTAYVVPLSAERDAAMAEVERFWTDIGMHDHSGMQSLSGDLARGAFDFDVGTYFDLQASGARDLHCPRTEVLPLRFSRGAMAEGCGKRASYWGNRLSAIVPMTP